MLLKLLCYFENVIHLPVALKLNLIYIVCYVQRFFLKLSSSNFNSMYTQMSMCKSLLHKNKILQREHMYKQYKMAYILCSRIVTDMLKLQSFYFKSRRNFIIPEGNTATWDLPSFTLIPPGVDAVLFSFQSLQLKRKSTRKQTCGVAVTPVDMSMLVQFSTKAVTDFNKLLTLFSSAGQH